ncbi:MAG: LysM peptidoglycan-binding domain-containing protein [Oscillochloris sp.]|nr:LysM peptidoglycan-binding domain-containing protein [Oscillochloris sp.]
MTLRILIVILVFGLAGALGATIAVLTAPQDPAATAVAATGTSTAASPVATAAATVTPEPATATVEATATHTPAPTTVMTPTPAITATPESTATPEATATPESTATPEATATPGSEIVEYVVQPGDVLARIADQFNTTIEAIVALNPGINPDSLTVGEVLRIPVGTP